MTTFEPLGGQGLADEKEKTNRSNNDVMPKILKDMKTTIFIIIAIFLIGGCHKPEVNYNEIFTAPKLKIKNNEVVATGGSSKVASASYVIPHVKIDENNIYVFGTLSLSTDITDKIKLPGDNEARRWEAYWINRDGTLVKLEIEN